MMEVKWRMIVKGEWRKQWIPRIRHLERERQYSSTFMRNFIDAEGQRNGVSYLILQHGCQILASVHCWDIHGHVLVGFTALGHGPCVIRQSNQAHSPIIDGESAVRQTPLHGPTRGTGTFLNSRPLGH